MIPKRNNKLSNSPELITFGADFGIPIQDSAIPEPSMTIVSDFGIGIVWQNV